MKPTSDNKTGPEKTYENQKVEKKRESCSPDQGSGATLWVLGFPNLKYCTEILGEIYTILADLILYNGIKEIKRS